MLYYTDSLIITNANGCVAKAAQGVTVFPAVTSVFTMSNNVICSGETVMLSSNPGAATYTWDFGDLTANGIGNVTNHIFVNSTTAPVVYTVEAKDNVVLRMHGFDHTDDNGSS